MNRIVAAFKCFFVLLFKGELPEDVARAFNFEHPSTVKSTAPAPMAAPALPQVKPADGAIQILGILQRDGRLIDFLMEDISGATDDQIGAAVRSLQEQCRAALQRYVRLTPLIDSVEGSYTKVDTNDPGMIKLLGNVPASGKAPGGILRHKGWRAEKVDLPALKPGPTNAVVAPAEIEIE